MGGGGGLFLMLHCYHQNGFCTKTVRWDGGGGGGGGGGKGGGGTIPNATLSPPE